MHDLTANQRVYEALRRSVPTLGAAHAGRISPLQLADDHRVSLTPVREALFRLAGERLVTLHPDGGFSENSLDATALADLQAWNGYHLLAAIHLLSDEVVSSVLAANCISPTERHPEVVDRVERLFRGFGLATGSAEFVVQIDSASKRLRRARLIEDKVFSDTPRELRSMLRRVVSDAKPNVRRRVLAYHRRRVEHAGQLAALLTRT